MVDVGVHPAEDELERGDHLVVADAEEGVPAVGNLRVVDERGDRVQVELAEDHIEAVHLVRQEEEVLLGLQGVADAGRDLEVEAVEPDDAVGHAELVLHRLAETRHVGDHVVHRACRRR